MGLFIDVEDVTLFNADADEIVVQAMIDDAEAVALAHVPELADVVDEGKKKSIKAILRQAINRWIEGANGAVVTEAAGPFSHTLDTRSLRKTLFFNGEIEQMRVIAGRKTTTGKAFSIDMTSSRQHPWSCSINFGGQCSCGLVDVGEVIA